MKKKIKNKKQRHYFAKKQIYIYIYTNKYKKNYQVIISPFKGKEEKIDKSLVSS